MCPKNYVGRLFPSSGEASFFRLFRGPRNLEEYIWLVVRRGGATDIFLLTFSTPSSWPADFFFIFFAFFPRTGPDAIHLLFVEAAFGLDVVGRSLQGWPAFICRGSPVSELISSLQGLSDGLDIVFVPLLGVPVVQATVGIPFCRVKLRKTGCNGAFSGIVFAFGSVYGAVARLSVDFLKQRPDPFSSRLGAPVTLQEGLQMFSRHLLRAGSWRSLGQQFLEIYSFEFGSPLFGVFHALIPQILCSGTLLTGPGT